MKTSDYYFHVQKDIGDFSGCKCIIAIMLADDFDEFESMNHTYLGALEEYLPSDFEEAMEAVYGCDRDLEEIRKDLLDRGFIESEKFSKHTIESFDQ